MVLCSNTVGPCRCSFCTGKPVSWWRSCKENGNPLWEYRDRGEGQCCGFALVSMRIRFRIHNFTTMWFRTKNCNFTDEKNPLFTENLVVSRPPRKMYKPYRRILQPSKKNIHHQNMKFLHFNTVFALLDPVPANLDSRSMQIPADPDPNPQHRRRLL
jgi:hypothetical protein